MIAKNHLVGQLHLKMYVAALGDLSLCADDQDCLKYAQEIKSWVCAARVCEGTGKNKRPLDCWKDRLREYTPEVMSQMGPLICPLISSPGIQTRRAIVRHLPVSDIDGEDTLVEYGAYLMALKGASSACEDYIKNYVGAYGPQWKFKWYRALSGCRILARERTREQEEGDFYTWFGVTRAWGTCLGIINSEMRRACNAPGATSPLPVYGQ